MTKPKKKTAGDRSKSSDREKTGQVRISAEDLPRRSLDDVVRIADVLNREYAGGPTSWDDLADALKIGKTTNATKYLFWAAAGYGIVKKEHDNKFSLAETGRKIVSPTYEGEDREAKIKAVLTPNLLSKFYTDYNGHLLPSKEHFPNVLEQKFGIPRDRVVEAQAVIVSNAQYTQILKKDGENESISLDAVSTLVTPSDVTPLQDAGIGAEPIVSRGADEWQSICFYITAIGDEGSEVRKHADMMLRHLVEPVVKAEGLSVIRADRIEKSGLITQQVFEHLVFAKLCVADLSFGNPNAFYELGIRHFCMIPTIQIVRKGDKIPFDVSQGRTITVDTSDVYTIMDKFQSARKELTEHVKNCLQMKSGIPSDDNPVAIYLPGVNVSLPKPLRS